MSPVWFRGALTGLALGVLSGCGEPPPGPQTAAPETAPLETAPLETAAEQAAPTPVAIPRTHVLSIESALLKRTYGLRVQLPAGYDNPDNADRTYPVVYLNDGPLNFQVAASVIQLPTSAGYIEDVILVGIGYSTETESVDSRTRDYTPTVNPAFQRASGGASQYLRFIEQELIPFVETRYRADPRRRALSGHSYGGLFVASALLEKPELFQHYIISSPSFWFHQNVMWRLEAEYAETHSDLPAKVYVSIGALESPRNPGGSDYDMVKDVRTFESLLKSRNYPGLELRTAVIEGHNHETVLPIALGNGVMWHFGARPDVPFGY